MIHWGVQRSVSVRQASKKQKEKISLPDKLWQQQTQSRWMQMIFVVTMGFVMDPKYEQCEHEVGICACWLEQPVWEEKRTKQSLNEHSSW